jgi:flagellar hook-basal body complex protein FliE
MSIDSISSNIVNLLNNEAVSLGSGRLTGQSGDFADILTETLKTADRTDALDKASTLQLLTGEADDLSGILIDAQKAELALQLALQIRNKVIDAYNEVMRMSV